MRCITVSRSKICVFRRISYFLSGEKVGYICFLYYGIAQNTASVRKDKVRIQLFCHFGIVGAAQQVIYGYMEIIGNGDKLIIASLACSAFKLWIRF